MLLEVLHTYKVGNKASKTAQSNTCPEDATAIFAETLENFSILHASHLRDTKFHTEHKPLETQGQGFWLIMCSVEGITILGECDNTA